jgi:hypothetical protein
MNRDKTIGDYTKDRKEVGVVLIENHNEALEPLGKIRFFYGYRCK